jgi:hypothetical protein
MQTKNTSNINIEMFGTFYKNIINLLSDHEIKVNQKDIEFTEIAIIDALKNDWLKCSIEFTATIENILAPVLSDNHEFDNSPYVREVIFPNGNILKAAIINKQSREWYGSETFIATCDFLIPDKQGIFKNCKTYLDLGGHQLIWACYYAGTHLDAKVTTFEPSILNVVIGAYNCLINGVIDRVEIVPYAVEVSGMSNYKEPSKMLVDFLNVPLKTITLEKYSNYKFDFTKTDIEGYEYDLLSDHYYLNLIKGAKLSHFELHCGHLIKRGINMSDCIEKLQQSGVKGVELYSNKEMYEFLKQSDPEGFHAFLVKIDN